MPSANEEPGKHGAETETVQGSDTIRIFARIRPCKDSKKTTSTTSQAALRKTYRLDQSDSLAASEPQLHFFLPKDEHQGLINNSRENYDFWFNRVFDQDALQEEVFDVVAKDVVDSVFDGYNGTIFAYGQTGSGKTFTITGGPKSYKDRGLIPRSIQYMFKRIRESKDVEYSVHISYLEIYNESGYDLLDSSRDYKKLEDMPKVTLQEDSEEMIHLRNLGSFPAQTEEDALNLLFIGDTNKMIAETPSNPASSRSHCLFILTLVGRRSGEDKITRSKLHLVDLAGSERVSRTKIDGTTLKEAKYINLSLHHLETVIIALHERANNKRVHIPYRNSMMTTILRDSLGGNCKTSMIATLATEQPLMEETISTARFAQRVALIRNQAVVNEELDLHLLVQKLRRQIDSLRSELAIARGGENTEGPLPEYEKQRVKQAVDVYLADPSPHSELLMTDFQKIQESFRIMKGYIEEQRKNGANRPAVPQAANATPLPSILDTDVMKLQQQVTQRDHEIAVLVSLLKKKEAEAQAAGAAVSPKKEVISSTAHLSPQRPFQSTPQQQQQQQQTPTLPSEEKTSTVITVSAEEKALAFQEFRNTYAAADTIDEHKATLKQKYAAAKALGEQANAHRMAVNELKSRLEKVTMQNMMARGMEGTSSSRTEELTRQEERLRLDMDKERTLYKNAFVKLKESKQEIEHLQHLMENTRIRMQRDFETWLVQEWKVPGRSNETSRHPRPISRADATSPQKLDGSIRSTSSLAASTRVYSDGTSRPSSAATSLRPSLVSSIPTTATSTARKNPPSLVDGEKFQRLVSLQDLAAPRQPQLRQDQQDTTVSQVLSRAGAVLSDRTVQDEIAAFYRARDALKRG